MKYLPASTFAVATLAAALTASSPAWAQSAGTSDSPKLDCAIGYVTGIGGSEQSFREYMATSERDRYRYFADNPIQCKISDEGRASACVGLTSLRNDKVSVYDEVDANTVAVVARVELEHGDYPVIIDVRKQDVKCAE
ncbi:hypothetical protein P3T18_006058 [Paraburkholderia sp. GAS199]|uniref:hypothetical protein n=1 Tax=Paraburkholderia sp. GAS199 TaxID=3035126 RepID=UPI003D2411EE